MANSVRDSRFTAGAERPSCPAWPNRCTIGFPKMTTSGSPWAIWTVFNNADILRKNRMMARLKVLIDKIGLDEFKQMVETELAGIGPIDHRPLMVTEEVQREEPHPLNPRQHPRKTVPNTAGGTTPTSQPSGRKDITWFM